MKILCAGDSLVNGFPFSRMDSFPSIIARKTGIEVTNIGMNGITADDTAAYLNRTLTEMGVADRSSSKTDDIIMDNSTSDIQGSSIPDAVLISCGSNDFMMGISTPEDVSRLINVMAAQAHAAGVSDVFVCAPPLTDPSKASVMWMPGVDYERVNRDLKEYRDLLEQFAINSNDHIDETPTSKNLENEKLNEKTNKKLNEKLNEKFNEGIVDNKEQDDKNLDSEMHIAKKHIHFVDVQSAYTRLAKYSDGVHPTKEGYQLIADTIIHILSQPSNL